MWPESIRTHTYHPTRNTHSVNRTFTYMAAAWNTWHIVRRTHQSASNQNSNYEKSKSKQNLQNAINENEIIELSPMNNKTVGSHWIARFGWLVDIRSNFHWISCVQVFSCFPSRYECKTGPSGELEGTFSIKRSQRINESMEETI